MTISSEGASPAPRVLTEVERAIAEQTTAEIHAEYDRLLATKPRRFIPPTRPTANTSQLQNVAYVNERSGAKSCLDLDRIEWALVEGGVIFFQETFRSARQQVESYIAKGWSLIANDPSPATDSGAASIAFLIDGSWRYLVLTPPQA